MAVSRILVPIDAKLPPAARAEPKPRDAAASQASTLFEEARHAGAALRPESFLVSRMLVPLGARVESLAQATPGAAPPRLEEKLFAEAMLENSPTRPRRRTRDLMISSAVHAILLATLVLLPLYFSEAIDLHQFNKTLLVPPPPPPPPPPPAAVAVARAAAPVKTVLAIPGKLIAPRAIPSRVAQLGGEAGAADAAPEIASGGMPGGVPGGQPGGVLGGVLGGTPPPAAPPAPAETAPKRPIRVGGEVKPPRLVLRTEPVYPPLARQARIAGAVLIDAVIDAEGNVVQMRVLSGHPALIPAALEALRHWKYEPTIVGGHPVPVQLEVTITFRLS